MKEHSYMQGGLPKKPIGARLCSRLSGAAIFLATGLSVRAAGAQAPASEVEAILRVCKAGPVTAVARAERLRGDAEVKNAGVLPNPSLVAEHQRTLSGFAEQETVIGLSVPLGIGGRRFVLQDAAESRRDQARADAEASVFDAALAFREAYLRALAQRARADVLGEQQAALDALSATIHGLTEGGEAAGYDLLRQQAQSRRHRSALEAARARALTSQAVLEAWTGSEVPISAGELPRLAGAARGIATGERKTSRLRSLEAAARASSLEVSAAQRRWVPDLEVFAGYRNISSDEATGHGISLSVTVPLTFFDHGQGEAARAAATRDLELALAARLRNVQRAEVRSADLHLEGLARALSEGEQAVLETTEIQRKAQSLYAAGEATITELLETFRAAEDARLARIDLMEERAQAELAFMRATGSMFDARLDRACRGSVARGTP